MSSEKEKLNSATNEKELNDLLDNALKDFEKSDQGAKTEDAEKPDQEVSEMWNDDFFTEQTQMLGERVNAIFGANAENEAISPEQMSLGFQKMAEAAVIALQGEAPPDDSAKKYADSISEALKGLKEGVDNLQAPVSETDVANMFSSLNLGDSEDSDKNPFLHFMQGMMESLLSAEILLPSIKELLEKYPKYLEENADKISDADRERYLKQQELFAVISQDLEAEKPDDSAAVKQERFKKVLDDMQKLHEYGQPPEGLEGAGGVPLPNLDGAAGNQCPLM